LIDYFTYTDEKEWINKFSTSPGWKYLNKHEFANEYKLIIGELIAYKKNADNLSRSKFFYIYIFEEIFRKYFGAEINMQREFMFNRAPFLDFIFIEELLKTYYAGVYNEFFTNNPIKRFKGQLPYAFIIKNSSPQLLDMMTGKGYKPKDLMSQLGKIRLLLNKLSGKYKDLNSDPYSVKRAFKYNLDYYKKVRIDESLFNVEEINNAFVNSDSINDLGAFIHTLSLNIFYNQNYGKIISSS
jgi:hypothetical protein